MGRVRNKLNDIVRPWINKRYRKRLINRDFTLIASNCNGAFILHDLGLRFNSPFVNLWMKPKDYIRMLSDLKGYMSEELSFINEDGVDYPVGLLRDVRVYFQHYDSEQEAGRKWDLRKARMNYDNLFILFTDQEGCSKADLEEFDRLPFSNKAVFTNKPYPELKSAIYIKGFETQKAVGNCFDFEPEHIGKKYYDRFDYVGWFNKPKEQLPHSLIETEQ